MIMKISTDQIHCFELKLVSKVTIIFFKKKKAGKGYRTILLINHTFF